MKPIRNSIAAFAAVCFLSATAFAADPSGTWKWTTQGRGGDKGGTPRESTLVLVMKDGNLAGKVTTPGRGGDPTTTEIGNASCKGDTVTFTIERTFGDNKMVTKYTGKLAGDTITGESESPGRDGGAVQKREWAAKRAK